jgi:hypothetical protein
MSSPVNEQIPPEILTAIAKRLRPSCPNIPEAEFQSLILDVARVKVKYDARNVADLAHFEDSESGRQRTA